MAHGALKIKRFLEKTVNPQTSRSDRDHVGVDIKKINAKTGLLPKEQECLDSLVDAWNIFVGLDRQHPDEVRDFADAIHAQQGLLSTRLARRIYPDGWPDI